MIKLNPQSLEALIDKTEFYRHKDTTLTICILTLKNDFMVTGESRPILASNFDEQKGQEAARAMAFDKLWALQGYHIKQQLSEVSANVTK